MSDSVTSGDQPALPAFRRITCGEMASVGGADIRCFFSHPLLVLFFYFPSLCQVTEEEENQSIQWNILQALRMRYKYMERVRQCPPFCVACSCRNRPLTPFFLRLLVSQSRQERPAHLTRMVTRMRNAHVIIFSILPFPLTDSWLWFPWCDFPLLLFPRSSAFLLSFLLLLLLQVSTGFVSPMPMSSSPNRAMSFDPTELGSTPLSPPKGLHSKGPTFSAVTFSMRDGIVRVHAQAAQPLSSHAEKADTAAAATAGLPKKKKKKKKKKKRG
jgi:hypothetical protein